MGDILVVDDDSCLRDVIVAVLEREGYGCRSAEDGKQALDMSAHAKPALVLLDAEMGVMDGWDCARELRAKHGNGVAIVMLADAPPRAENVADGVLTKPFAIEQLRRVVASYVGPRR